MAKTPKSTHARMMEELNRTLKERPKVESEDIKLPRAPDKKPTHSRTGTQRQPKVDMEELQREMAKSMARRHPTSTSNKDAKGKEKISPNKGKEKARPKKGKHYDKSITSIAGSYEGVVKYKQLKKSPQDKLVKISAEINDIYQKLLNKHKGNELKATEALVSVEFPKLLHEHRKSKDFDMYQDYLTRVAQARLDSFLPSTAFPDTKLSLDSGLSFDREKYKTIIKELYDTEKSYNQKLGELNNILTNLETRDPGNKPNYAILRGNLTKLISCSQNYLTQLEGIDVESTPEQWIAAFLEANSPDALIAYGNELGEAAQTYDIEKLAALRRILQTDSGSKAFKAEKTDSVDLQSLMILPIQRAPRLMLLAKEVNKDLVEHSNASDGVKEYCRNIQELLDKINKSNNTKTGNYETMHTFQTAVATIDAKHGHVSNPKSK